MRPNNTLCTRTAIKAKTNITLFPVIIFNNLFFSILIDFTSSFLFLFNNVIFDLWISLFYCLLRWFELIHSFFCLLGKSNDTEFDFFSNRTISFSHSKLKLARVKERCRLMKEIELGIVQFPLAERLSDRKQPDRENKLIQN